MNFSIKNVVGKQVRQSRLRKKLTQDQLSAKLARLGCQIDRARISKIETGSRCVYDYELKALGKALNTSIAQILGD